MGYCPRGILGILAIHSTIRAPSLVLHVVVQCHDKHNKKFTSPARTAQGRRAQRFYSGCRSRTREKLSTRRDSAVGHLGPSGAFAATAHSGCAKGAARSAVSRNCAGVESFHWDGHVTAFLREKASAMPAESHLPLTVKKSDFLTGRTNIWCA